MMPSRRPRSTSNDTPSTTRSPADRRRVRSLDLQQRHGAAPPVSSTAGAEPPVPVPVGDVDDARERRRRGRRPTAQPRVDGLAQPVAEEVEAERGAARRRGRGTRAAPGCTVTVCCSSLEHPPPRRRARPASARGSSAPPRRARRGAAISESCTITVGAMLGRMWRHTVRHVDEPDCAGGEDVVLGQHARHLGRARRGRARRRSRSRWPATPSRPTPRGRRRTRAPGSASAGRSGRR